MPTLLLQDGYRFFFYSNENNEPAHIHVKKGDGEGKIWLEPALRIGWIHGFTNREENAILQIVNNFAEQFKTNWYEYFGE